MARWPCPLWVISGHRRADLGMSALPPKADMFSVEIDVCFVPIADIAQAGKRPVRDLTADDIEEMQADIAAGKTS